MEGGIAMTRIQPLDPDRAQGDARALLASLRGELGFVPLLMRLLAHSPPALAGYLGLRASLKESTLAAPLRERIAIAVAAMNECDPCLASHMRFGRDAGLSEGELYAAGQWRSADPAAAAALDFARALWETRGRVDDAALAALRETGFTDAAIIEIVATVAANIFANFVNNLARSEPDRCDLSPSG
jgi:uncharacterized peroxidase-related enzyme